MRDRLSKHRSSYPEFEHTKHWSFEELAKPIRIGEWEFPARSIVVRDENGVIRSATLADNINFENIELSSGYIEFINTGRTFGGASLTKPYQKDGLLLPVGTGVSVGINGLILAARSNSDMFFNGNPVASIRFQNTGAIDRLKLGRGAELYGQKYKKPLSLHYNKAGELSTLFADEPVSINEIVYDGNWVYFQPNGSVRSGILNLDTRINDVLYAAGTEILLNENGDVSHSFRRRPRWPDGVPPEPAKKGNSLSVLAAMRLNLQRSVLIEPLTSERCTELFGEPDESGSYKKRASSSSIAASMELAEYGCGITDKLAGILDRG